MENLSQIYIKGGASGQYIVYFLNNDEGQSVHVEETDEIILSKVIQHVNLGGSVFITQRRNPNPNISSRKTSIVNRLRSFDNLSSFNPEDY